MEAAAGSQQAGGLGEPAVRVGPQDRAVLADGDVERGVGERHLLGAAEQERELEAVLALHPGGGLELLRRVVEADRPRAAAGHPGADVARAAAELDRVRAVEARVVEQVDGRFRDAVQAPRLVAGLCGPRRSRALATYSSAKPSQASRLAATCSGSSAGETSRGAVMQARRGGGRGRRAAARSSARRPGAGPPAPCRRRGRATRRRRARSCPRPAAAGPGRPAGPGRLVFVSIVSPTVISSVAGSRPSASHAARMSAIRPVERSSGKPNQAVFQASACWAVRRSMRSPLAAMRIGIRPGSRPGRGGGGSRTASSTSWNRPWNVTRSPRTSGRMISSDSSNRPTRWSNG